MVPHQKVCLTLYQKHSRDFSYLTALLENPLLCLREHFAAALLNRLRNKLPALPANQINFITWDVTKSLLDLLSLGGFTYICFITVIDFLQAFKIYIHGKTDGLSNL